MTKPEALEAKASKPRKSATPTKRQGKTKGSNSGNPAPATMTAEEKERTLQYFRKVSSITCSSTFSDLQKSILDPHIIEDGESRIDPDFKTTLEITEYSPCKRFTYTAEQLQRFFDSCAKNGFNSAIEEIFHFYSMFFPDDSKAIFRLAVTAGYILDSGRLKEHLRA